MGKIIVKTPEGGGNGPGAMIHIPEELWDLAKKHEVYLEDGTTGERYLVIDMTTKKGSALVRERLLSKEGE